MPPSSATPRMAKIVATLGPASESPAVLAGLLQAGVDVFRLNMSHGTREDHHRRMGDALVPRRHHEDVEERARSMGP